MDHIEKFRTDCVHDDRHNLFKSKKTRKHDRQAPEETVLIADELLTSESEQIKNDVLVVALASLAICEDTSAQDKPIRSGWRVDDLDPSSTHMETRNYMHEVSPYPLLPPALYSNGFISLMPSTSAQARALSLAMSGNHTDSSDSCSSSLLSPFSSRSPMSSSLQHNPQSKDSMQAMTDASEVSPSSSLLYHPHNFDYDSTNSMTNPSVISKGKGNSTIETHRMDICDDEYVASLPDER